ncbi:Glutamyl-tRNA(Gln) amidotransferase subunit A [Posidoniimonas polymericola]|uniref:Glutamyl-tRNA(Gln) amidotransferase subunit A n=1 Tax=Posidoniimonas polymericola TaxID=2528002 RepID=A0A5C5YM32_9BACT|nr:Asp-tRNA(Asn)/Glu-tRNA(Gln) amidotransferase subunit GatA [Posidoniimonas polymericola]TWT76021.1 Glutamyl-tRNA(Gln) amidotransferase subunit A [Posidoniimonas polymericola]
MTLVEQSAADLLKQLAAGELTSRELTQAYLDQIEQHDARVGAFLRVNAEAALKQADTIDRRRGAGEQIGVLGGLPVAVKDLLCQTGEPTTCASRMLEDFRPPYDSTVVAKLKAADAVLLGRTNMDEFAMGGSTENSAFQPTRNPWDLERSPGGSSGGAAACVAAGMAPLSIGTDTGGSIRQPSAFCGVVGMKPTYGRVSRYGLVAFASSLDQAGPISGTVADTALLLQAIAGHDPRDSTSLNAPTPDYTADVDKPLEGLRLGVVKEHFGEGLDPEVDSAVRAAIAAYEAQGAKIVELSLPHSRFAVATYYVIAPCEASSNLARYDGAHYGRRTEERAMLASLQAERKAAQEAGDADALDNIDTALVRMYRQSRSEAIGPEVKRRIMLGAYALSAGYYDAYYLKALKVRRLIRQDFDQAFEKVDMIVGPTTAGPANKLGEFADDPLGMYLLDLYTVSANLAGLPAMSLPCGATKSGMPIGLQLHAPPLEESRLLRAARMFEQSGVWKSKRCAL